MLQTAYNVLFGAAFVIMGICVFLLLLRSIKGPGVTVRVIAVNMIGSTVTSICAMLAALYREGWLFDVCIVYVLISFLAVVILSKVYMRKRGGESRTDEGQERSPSSEEEKKR